MTFNHELDLGLGHKLRLEMRVSEPYVSIILRQFTQSIIFRVGRTHTTYLRYVILEPENDFEKRLNSDLTV